MKKKRQQKAALATKPSPAPAAKPPLAAPLLAPSQLATLLALLALLAIAPYVNTLSSDFTLDDFPIIVENPLIRDTGNIGQIFTTKYWSATATGLDRGLYRPFTVFTYALDYSSWELRPKGYHLFNMAVHTGTTLVFFVVATIVLGSPMAAFVAAAIFAVHPVHTEAVTSVVGRAELLAALFFMLAFWFGRSQGISWRRPSGERPALSPRLLLVWGAAALFYFLGLLSKEIAFTLPVVLLVYDLTHREEWLARPNEKRPAEPPKRGRMVRRYAGFAIVLLVYLPLRHQVVGTVQAVWSGFASITTDERVLTASRVLMEYLGLLVFPRTLSADYWIPDVPFAQSPAEPLVLLSLLLWVVLGAVAVFSWRKSPPLLFALAWFFITILPVSNLLFAAGHGKAERILYLPSAGFCLFIGGLYGLLEKKVRKEWLLLLPLFPILFVFLMRTYIRNADWKNNFTLALATLKVSPTSPLFNQIAASEYRKRGQVDRALPLLQEAIRQRPEEYSYHYNLGNIYLERRQYDLAIAAYQEALRRRPNYIDALNNLGRAQMETQRNADAVKTFTTILSLDRKYLASYLNLGTAYLNLENLPEAARVFREGLALFPNVGGLHFNLAVVLKKMGQAQEASQAYQKAMALDPSLKGLPF